jgi:hypothetical protein
MVSSLFEKHTGILVNYNLSRSQQNNAAINKGNSTLDCPGSATFTSKARGMPLSHASGHMVLSSVVEGTSVSSV